MTGGASGIGRALGAQLTAAGARVVLADVEPGDGVVPLDVRDLDAFRALVDDIGPVDLLFGNAGISVGGATHEMTDQQWEDVIDVNLRGVLNGVRAVYPSMVERGRGHIVNTASGAGLVAPPFVAAYAMTKHAVVGLSTSLRAEAALHGVKVSVLCPGAVETPILDRRTSEVTAREYLGVVRQKPIDVDRFARLALRAVARDKGIIVVPAQARSLWYLNRLSPTLVDRATKLIARRVDRTLLQR